jgi:hypothetical protein
VGAIGLGLAFAGAGVAEEIFDRTAARVSLGNPILKILVAYLLRRSISGCSTCGVLRLRQLVNACIAR